MGRVCKSKEIKPTIILVGIWRLATSRISLKGLEWEQHMIYLDAIIVPSSLLPSIRLDTSLFYYEVNLQQVITPIHIMCTHIESSYLEKSTSQSSLKIQSQGISALLKEQMHIILVMIS